MSNRNFKEKFQTIRKGTILPVVTGLCLLIGISNAHAISNGGFEVGTFGSWDTIGVTSVETAGLGTGPTEGTYQGLLSNDFGSATQSSLESTPLSAKLCPTRPLKALVIPKVFPLTHPGRPGLMDVSGQGASLIVRQF